MPTARLTIKAPSTTGNHISLVEGKHSLEVKGDLARKVAGALGIKVEGDIVLESSGSISLKAGGSFIVIQAGGVDIVGPKINLNGGGSPGTPVGILQPGVPQGLFDEQFRVLGDKGKPMVNVPYFICSEDGQIFKGFTDVQGLCKRVFTNESAKLTVWLGIDALEKW